ncbi:MAG TPA: M20/M25/M40 family metallo-hydrolase, partial [Longimicrobiales bacterium]
MPRALSCRSAVAALAAAAALGPLGACHDAPTASSTPVDTVALGAAAAGITQARIDAHVAFLAGDALRGRLTPSPQLALAAEYIGGEFRAAGAQPGGNSGFFQPIPCGPVSSLSATNVVALLPGSDSRRKGEWVVVSAHFDHMGVGLPDARGDSIYNGADDNASGTAALIEVARAFASSTQAPPRSLAFVAVSGEEQGLIGSQYFVEHVPAGIGRMVANVNLDMLGRNAPDLLYLVGDSITTLGDVARAQVAAHAELRFHAYSVNGGGTYAASDQFSFALAGVPAIFLHTGGHPQLHTPADEVRLLDTDKITRAARLAFYLTWAVASAEGKPAFTPSGQRWLAT